MSALEDGQVFAHFPLLKGCFGIGPLNNSFMIQVHSSQWELNIFGNILFLEVTNEVLEVQSESSPVLDNLILGKALHFVQINHYE